MNKLSGLVSKWWWMGLIVLVALFIRGYKINEVPMSLYYDEIDLGYQVRSLVETGKDYRGSLSPFFVRSFNTDKTPIPVYLSIPGLLFADPYLQVRMPTVAAGVMVVLLGMILVLSWTKNKLAAALVGVVMAFSPWMIQFSRIAFEAIYVLMFYLSFLIFFFKWLKEKKLRDYYLAIIFLSLGVYVYRIMSFYVPLTFALVCILFFKDLWRLGIKHLAAGAILAGAIVLPFLYATTIGSADQTRIEQVSVFSDPLVPIFVMRNREVDSGDFKEEKVGNQATFASKVLHNKPLSWLQSFKNNYFRSFSSELLFVTGDLNLRQGTGKTGHLLWIDIVGLAFGLLFVARNIADKKYQWLVIWLLSAPIPGDLTFDGAYHTSRLIMMALPLTIIIGLGWWRLFILIRSAKKMKLLPLILGFWVIVAGQYLHRYFVHFPLESARWHGYGFEQMVKKVMAIEGNYDKVVMSHSYDPPMLYFLFWANVPPSEVAAYGSEFGRDITKGARLDKFKVESWSKITEKVEVPRDIALAMEEGTLYVITSTDARLDWRSVPSPTGVLILDSIQFPDRSEVAFYLITKDPAYKPVVKK